MARAEAVKEMQHWHTARHRAQMRHDRQIRRFLHRRRAEHPPARTAHRHHIAVVAEDGQRVVRQRPRRDVHHPRQQLARNFAHIRQHQQQPLRRGEGRRQRTRREHPVQRARRAALALHLRQPHFLPEHVAFAHVRPLVTVLCHRRRRRNRVNRRRFAECVCHLCRCQIAIAHHRFHPLFAPPCACFRVLYPRGCVSMQKHAEIAKKSEFPS